MSIPVPQRDYEWKLVMDMQRGLVRAYITRLLDGQDGSKPNLSSREWQSILREVRFIAQAANEAIDIRQLLAIMPDELLQTTAPSRVSGVYTFAHTVEGEVRKGLYCYLIQKLEAYATTILRERGLEIAPQ